MRAPREPLFLARESYRRRRLMDAARLLPVVGALSFAVPLLWSDGASTSWGWLYLFLVWLMLIAASWLVSRRLMPPGQAGARAGEDGDV